MALLKIEQTGHVLTIGLDRPEKRNAISLQMMRELASAYTALCDDPDLRCGVLYSTSDVFCAGLDLFDMGPALMGQDGDAAPAFVSDDQVDPFNWASVAGRQGRRRTKPIVTAVNGRCMTAGIELALATDIVVAETTSTFAQSEVKFGLMPLGGAIERFTQRLGWGDAMRLLLTGDTFSAEEAHALGIVQRLTAEGGARETAQTLARSIADNAPLAVQGVLQNAYEALDAASEASSTLRPYMLDHVSQSNDLREGIAAMVEKRPPAFRGA